MNGIRWEQLKKSLKPMWPGLLLLLIVVNYNNCSSTKLTYDENPSLNKASGLDLQSLCSQSEIDVFKKGYYPFLQTNCASCHSNGPGKGTFANSDLSLAFDGFQTIGYEKISANAVSDSHNYPYTGGHNLATISDLKDQWRTFLVEKKSCENSGSNTTTSAFNPKFMSIKKAVPKITGTPRTVNINGTNTSIIQYNTATVTFNFDQDLNALTNTAVPQTGGGSLTLSITGYSTPSGLTGYSFAFPKLKTGSSSIHFKGFHIYLNGYAVPYAITFQNLEKELYKNSESLLTGGSMLVLGPLLDTDQIAIAIGDLSVVDLAAPPAPPTLQFALSNATVAQNQLGYAQPYKVLVQLSSPSAVPVTVGLATSGDETQAQIAKGVLGPDGRRRFDWDYQIKSSLNITFGAGETQKEIDLIFSDDLRDDVDKTLTLNLVNPFGADLGTKKSIVLSLPDYNPTPTSPETTFADLMYPGGVLEANCVKCHNSVDRQGGYDMTDYQLMVDKGIIVPGNSDVNAHKMYRRMNPDAPDAGTVSPMPLKGYLSQDQTLIVEDWIKAGAKNN